VRGYDEHARVRPERGGFGQYPEPGAVGLRRNVRHITSGTHVDLALELRRDDRAAAGYLLDGHVQPLAGEQAVVLRDVQAGQIVRRERGDRYGRTVCLRRRRDFGGTAPGGHDHDDCRPDNRRTAKNPSPHRPPRTYSACSRQLSERPSSFPRALTLTWLPVRYY
jgi:hypothetical protein